MGKKHLSVLMLYIRSSITPLLCTVILVAGIQTGLFLWELQRGAAALETAMQPDYFKGAFIGGIIFLVAFLYRMNGGGYTLRRLRISERTVFLWHVLSCFLCLMILWMAEIVVLTALCRYFLTQKVASGLSNQALFLAFYRNPFLHSVLPLESVSRWIYLFFAFTSLAFVTAGAVVRKRYGRNIRNNAPLSLTVVAMLFYFVRPLGSLASDVMLCLFHLAVILYSLWDVWFNAEEVTSDEND